ncbi:hypothetical protein [Rhizohabitans arisaemae]|nr:hypothetical protein [Rhizohabitans arisaemae]
MKVLNLRAFLIERCHIEVALDQRWDRLTFFEQGLPLRGVRG